MPDLILLVLHGKKTISNSELAILPVDGYHAAGTDPDNTARVTLDFIARHS